MKKPSLIEWIVVTYTAVQSRQILTAWFGGTLTLHGWLPFLIWLLPVILTFFISKKGTSLPLMILALACSLLGTLGSINTLHYTAFACAWAALLPPTWKVLPYLGAFICWTPAFGWAVAHVIDVPMLLVRIALAVCASGYMSAILFWREVDYERE